MRRLLLGAVSFLLLCDLLCSCPAAAFLGPGPGVRRAGEAPLDSCQKRFAEALKFQEKERDYADERTRYQEEVSNRCAGKNWYDIGFLECALFVPLFGLILPFFGMMFFGTVRSLWRSSSARATK